MKNFLLTFLFLNHSQNLAYKEIFEAKKYRKPKNFIKFIKINKQNAAFKVSEFFYMAGNPKNPLLKNNKNYNYN
jgi:hypothetical protein